MSNLATPPATLAEWWTALSDQFSASGHTVGLGDLYSETPTRHEVRVNGRVHYTYCAMDALMAAVIVEQATVRVRSVDPVTGVPVTFRVTDDAVEVSPTEAVICFGGRLDEIDVEAAGGSFVDWAMQEEKEEVVENVCQYTNAFESVESYKRWEQATDSMTVPLPPQSVVPLLREFFTES